MFIYYNYLILNLFQNFYKSYNKFNFSNYFNININQNQTHKTLTHTSNIQHPNQTPSRPEIPIQMWSKTDEQSPNNPSLPPIHLSSYPRHRKNKMLWRSQKQYFVQSLPTSECILFPYQSGVPYLISIDNKSTDLTII